MEDQAYSFLEIGFQMCTHQFAEVGLLPMDREEFHDFDKVIASLMTESTANEESDSEDEDLEDVIDVDP